MTAPDPKAAIEHTQILIDGKWVDAATNIKMEKRDGDWFLNGHHHASPS